MAELWAYMILKGKRTYAQVPAKLKTSVAEVLIECGHEELVIE